MNDRMLRVCVDDVLRGVVPEVEPRAAARQLSFTAALSDAQGDPSAEVWADAERLRRILLALLDNAIKYTPAGGHVGIACTGRAGARGEVYVRVSDSGVGVARERQDAIFESADLGEARRLARAMGGDLRVRSEPGRGATFTVTLRRAEDEGD